MLNFPKYRTPPVTEVVLNIQFNPLESYSNAYAGWFWKEYLGTEWTTTRDAPHLPEKFEKFDANSGNFFVNQLHIRTDVVTERTQFFSNDRKHLIQIQSSRFIYNWIKQDNDYPTYELLLPEFKKYFKLFEDFVRDNKLGQITPNQWEVIYVNNLNPQGQTKINDLSSIFNGFYIPTIYGSDVCDGVDLKWSHIIGENRGRLVTQIKHITRGGEESEFVELRFTARGPLERGMPYEDGFAIGREAIVKTFAQITDQNTQKNVWEKVE